MRSLTRFGDRVLRALVPESRSRALCFGTQSCGSCFEDKNGNLIQLCCTVSGQCQQTCSYRYC